MFNQKTSQDLLSVTSLQVSVGGHTHYDSQEYQTITRAGQARHHASHSVLPESSSDNLTSDTLPRNLCGSLSSASLQSSLASRLRQRLENTGSMIYSLSWKDKATPAGRQYCQRVASVPRTKGIEFSLAPLTNWPTPTANNGTGPGVSGRQGGMNLQTAVSVTAWPTPTTIDNSQIRGEGKTIGTSRGTTLGGAARLIDKPIRIIAVTGQTLIGSAAGMDILGQLNPAHSRWLMGFPPEWDACAVTAMPSSRK